jgi:Ca-activated chloride channel homolog
MKYSVSIDGRFFHIALAFSFIVSTLLITPAANAQGTGVRVESFSLRPDGQVRIENARGATSVEVWDGSTVRMIAEKRSTTGNTIKPSDLVLMAAQNTLLIQCKQNAEPGRIDLMIYIPRRTQLQVVGGVWPVNVGGPVSSAVVESTSGSIQYRMPTTDDARVVMRSARGSVKSMVPLAVSQRTGTRSLDGSLGRGTSLIFLSTQSGNITLMPGPASTPVAAIQDESGDAAQQIASNNQGVDSRQTQRPNLRTNTPQSSNPDDDTDPSSIAVPPSRRAPQQTGAQSSSGGGGPAIFAGTDSDTHRTSSDRIGPIEHQRQESKTRSGSSGIGVKIIPADRALGSRPDQSPSIYDDPQNDTSRSGGGQTTNNRSSQPSPAGGRNSGYDTPPVQTYPRTSTSRPGDESAGEIAEANPKPGAPPVLRRRSDEANDSARPAAGENPKPSGDDDTIVLNSSLVSLNVSVTNRAGLALANLAKEDFQVLDNGESQKVEFFAPSNAPFNLVLVLDLSGSIKEKLGVVKSAALRFIDAVGEQDKVAVLAFTDHAQVISQLTTNRDMLRKRIKAIEQSGGGTAFYETMWFAVTDTLRGTQGQRNAIVVMTDGVDSSLDRYDPAPSRVSFNQLARRLEESDVIVFPVYLDTEYDEVFIRLRNSSEAYAIARLQLERLAELTGGMAYRAEKVGDLSGVYKQVAAALRTVYSVGYYPTRTERDGTFHRVNVRVSRPEAAVRTRRGYYAK